MPDRLGGLKGSRHSTIQFQPIQNASTARAGESYSGGSTHQDNWRWQYQNNEQMYHTTSWGFGSRDYVGICAFPLGPPSQFVQVVVPYSAMLLWLKDMEPVKAAAVKSTLHTDECLEEVRRSE